MAETIEVETVTLKCHVCGYHVDPESENFNTENYSEWSVVYENGLWRHKNQKDCIKEILNNINPNQLLAERGTR